MVDGVGLSRAGETRSKLCTVPKMIVPSRFHDPPRGTAVRSQMVWGGPPETSIFLSFIAAPYATNRLSGDQKSVTETAGSESGRGWALRESSVRSQQRPEPLETLA